MVRPLPLPPLLVVQPPKKQNTAPLNKDTLFIGAKQLMGKQTNRERERVGKKKILKLIAFGSLNQ